MWSPCWSWGMIRKDTSAMSKAFSLHNKWQSGSEKLKEKYTSFTLVSVACNHWTSMFQQNLWSSSKTWCLYSAVKRGPSDNITVTCCVRFLNPCTNSGHNHAVSLLSMPSSLFIASAYIILRTKNNEITALRLHV